MLHPAHAQSLLSAEGIAKGFFRYLGTILIKLGSLILNTVLQLFEWALSAGFRGQSDVARIGWTVSRDIANMFFILILVVIAFATILRFERYGAKQLLPKVIIIALLINFSLVLCYVLIDFTNIAANYFVTNATNGGQTQLSKIFLDGLQLSTTLTASFCEQFLIRKDECATLYANGDQMDIPVCQFKAQENFNKCSIEISRIKENANQEEDVLQVIVSQLGSAIIIFIAAFVIAAGAILLVIRSIAIWFFVIISPLAFICYILPSLRRHWESWINQFTRWCIFAPAYAFFIWLAAKICTQRSIEKIGAVQSSLFIGQQEIVSQFFSDPNYIFSFIFTAGFLIAALIAANQLGIRGAAVAMSVGKRWTNTAKGWAKKQTVDRGTRLLKETGQAYGGAAGRIGGKLLQRIPGFKKTGARMEAKGEMRMERVAESPQVKAREQQYARMTTEQRAIIMNSKTTADADKLVLARLMKDKDLKKVDTKTASHIKSSFAAYGRREEADAIEKARPDTIVKRTKLGKIDEAATKEAQIAAVKELKDKGKANDLLPIAMKSSSSVAQGVADNYNQREVERYAAIDKEHRDVMSKTYSDTMDRTAPTDPKLKQYMDTFSSINVGYIDEVEDESKQRLVAKYAGSHNRLKDLPENAVDNENIAAGAIESSSTSELKEFIKSGKTTSDAIKRMAQTIATSSRYGLLAQQKSQIALATLSGSLKGLSKINFAKMAKESQPDDWSNMASPDFSTGTGPDQFRDLDEFVDVLTDNMEGKNYIPMLKKMGQNLAKPIVKAVEAKANTNSATPAKRILYADVLRNIESDPTTKAML